MSVYDDKETLNYAIKKIDYHINIGDSSYVIYSVKHDEKLPELGNLILVKTKNKFIISNSKDKECFNNLIQINKKELIKELKDFEDVNYKLYFQQVDQHLVGYLLDFFIYYVDMPDKIISVCDDNISREIFLKAKT